MRRRTFVAVALLAACSGPPVGTRVAARADDTQTALTRANEPRTGDPTAASATTPNLAPARPAPAASASADPAMIATSKPKSSTPPSRIGARHVLIQWMGSERAGSGVLRSREQARAIAEEVLKKAKAGADLGRLAVEYSDEPNAGPRGGSLGRFGKGQMVPAFEEAAFKLEVGEISDIVETPFGFHIIQRTE